METRSAEFLAQTEQLLGWLGYCGSVNWVTPKDINRITGYRHTLRQAFADMSVIGAFGLIRDRGQAGLPRFLPFVYVAVADREEDVRHVHRKVWSQGVVPFLLVLTPNRIWSCNATSFTSDAWNDVARGISWPDFSQEQVNSTSLTAIAHLRAHELRSSVRLGGVDDVRPDRVDERLLGGLEALSAALVKREGLHVSTANRLLGSFLYLFFLTDRGVITQQWLHQRDHHGIQLYESNATWKPDDFWRLLDDLDSVFNGKVFALPISARAAVTEQHITLIRRVLKHGERIEIDGLQTSFIDIDLSVLRTETLSAVYEMFFENHGGGRRTEEGAFYTPPYLVDYVLVQVEELVELGPDKTVCDCSAGSGIFLVGALRRILERILEKTLAEFIPLVEARKILVNCIFGIERNPDAAQVAAFSLFLTMLEYISPEEWPGRGAIHEATVFPDVVDRTLLVRDLFSEEKLPIGFPPRFDCAVGNPPWQKVSQIGELAVRRLEDQTRKLYNRVDRARAAELFFWTAYEEFLGEDGVFGILLSAKSFLSPGSNQFPRVFLEAVAGTGVANLTHLRRKLFPGAEHPAVAAFGRKRAVTREDILWVYYPLLSSLPLARDSRPWCIIQDSAEVERHRRVDLCDGESLFRALMLRPIDRRIVSYLDDKCRAGQATALGVLCEQLNLEFGRGGSPAYTKLAPSKILGSDIDKPNYYRRRLGLEPDLLPTQPYEFKRDDLENADQRFRSRFSGDIVAIPRSLAQVDFIEKPFAFNSSLVSINWKRDDRPLSAIQGNLLKAVARYLDSGFFRYVAALYGRMWIVDKRRMEVGDLRRVPMPITSVDDPRINEILASPDSELNAAIMRGFGFSGEYAQAAQEYTRFRSRFENGVLPQEANAPPEAEEIDLYVETLRADLTRSLTHAWHINAHKVIDTDRAVGVVEVLFSRDGSSLPSDDPGLLNSVISAYEFSGRSLWIDSVQLSYDQKQHKVILLKPLTASKWTVERAVAESGKILSLILSGSARAKAAA